MADIVDVEEHDGRFVLRTARQVSNWSYDNREVAAAAAALLSAGVSMDAVTRMSADDLAGRVAAL